MGPARSTRSMLLRDKEQVGATNSEPSGALPLHGPAGVGATPLTRATSRDAQSCRPRQILGGRRIRAQPEAFEGHFRVRHCGRWIRRRTGGECDKRWAVEVGVLGPIRIASCATAFCHVASAAVNPWNRLIERRVSSPSGRWWRRSVRIGYSATGRAHASTSGIPAADQISDRLICIGRIWICRQHHCIQLAERLFLVDRGGSKDGNATIRRS